MAQEEPLKVAAIALIRNKEGKYASLWNKHFQGYTLPGGKMESGENVFNTLKREIKEELGIEIDLVRVSPSWEEWIQDESGKERFIVIHEITSYNGIPESKEPGSNLIWFTEEELCNEELCPFARINKKMFEREELRYKIYGW